MEHVVTAPQRNLLLRRVGPIACGGALAGAAAYLSSHNPAANGARFPSCVFHDLTGLWCPGCGLTRGTYQLLHGHIGAALSYNMFTPLAVAAVVVSWFSWFRQSWGRPALRAPDRTGRLTATMMPVLVIGYGVLRNIPVGPLRALAP